MFSFYLDVANGLFNELFTRDFFDVLQVLFLFTIGLSTFNFIKKSI